MSQRSGSPQERDIPTVLSTENSASIPLPLPPIQADSYGSESKCRCRCHKHCDNEHKQPESDEGNYYTEWTWDHTMNNENTELSSLAREVTFHKHFSNGTAAIRGSTALTEDQHYWEIKMTTSVYGTDMMLGFGTGNVDLQGFATTFTSLLGCDSESWGLSYTGYIIHNGMKRHLCKSFGKGVTIGIHLDMWLGKMSLFRNGKFIGVGFSKGLRGKELYPMACSTAARTGMRIVRSTSFPTSLQFMCCQALRNAIPSHQGVTDAVSIAPGLRLFLLNNLDWLLRPYNPELVKETVCTLRKRGAVNHVQETALKEESERKRQAPPAPSPSSSEHSPVKKRRCYSDSTAGPSHEADEEEDDDSIL